MRNWWDGIPALVQDLLLSGLFLLPLIGLGVVLLRRFAPWPLVRGILWRFRWPNVLFVLLIAISVGMGIGLIAQERGLRQGTAQAADKFDMVISAPGSELTMMLAAVFLQPTDVPMVDGPTYADIANHDRIAFAAPIGFGDSYAGHPIVGTIADFISHLTESGVEGRVWEQSGEAVVGALVRLEIGDRFEPAHGIGFTAEVRGHDGEELVVVGRMPRTGSPWDKAILIPIETVWEVHGLPNGHPFEEQGQIGPPFDPAYFPGTPAVIVRAESLAATYALRTEFTRENETMAFFPGTVLANLYSVMGDIRQAMSLMSIVTQVLVAISVLLGLFILSRLFQRQVAMLRALGAPRRFVMAVVWLYGVVLLGVGTALGLVFGLIAAAVLSLIVTQRTGVLVTASLGWGEVHLALAFLSVTALLSLLPALVVLRQPIAENLR